ncbi:hypothetical protein BDP81DRAFT_54719 [Colletotrichum phormii]|uniref:Uncharacterized protein n=1 Tax=Colletotrichum phormii TaxID=359342 RepID=A0AAI9ZQF2_9PEZI|nr:uncharacterized protein BDP81DRAFT_54719 [Colletotrichum phormii]KAK1634919.1 hypothetical protein BDP81DRAFT_54719 [Colletotrichum phormii]
MKLDDSIQHELGMNLGLIFLVVMGLILTPGAIWGRCQGRASHLVSSPLFRCLKQFLSWGTSSVVFVLAVKLRRVPLTWVGGIRGQLLECARRSASSLYLRLSLFRCRDEHTDSFTIRLSWSSKWRGVMPMDRGISGTLVSPSRSGHGLVEPQAPGTDCNRALLRQLGLQDPGIPAPTLSRCDLGKDGPSVRCREVAGSRSPSRMITKAGQAAGSAPRHHRRTSTARKPRGVGQGISAESSVASNPPQLTNMVSRPPVVVQRIPEPSQIILRAKHQNSVEHPGVFPNRASSAI